MLHHHLIYDATDLVRYVILVQGDEHLVVVAVLPVGYGGVVYLYLGGTLRGVDLQFVCPRPVYAVVCAFDGEDGELDLLPALPAFEAGGGDGARFEVVGEAVVFIHRVGSGSFGEDFHH